MGAHTRDRAVLVLAAGQGTRMKSRLAKVLHEIAGRPMLHYPLAAATLGVAPDRAVVVVGRDADRVREAFEGRATFALQADQKGTGHAVLCAREALADFRGDLFILYGDTPLLTGDTLARMLETKERAGADLVLLTAPVDVRGIVIRGNDGRVQRIVESTDASPDELAIPERNTGVYLLDAELLWKTLAQVGDQNEQAEVYLTDIVELCVSEGRRVEAVALEDGTEALGVDNRAQLAEAEREIRRRTAARHQAAGVTIVDPETTYIDVDVEIGPDTRIEPGCVIQGPSRIGRGAHIRPHCTIESSVLGDDVVIGPSAHLRPNCVLGKGVRIGNFVEVKNSTLGDGVKADHLSYVGDADVGAGASFGCGSIVVNYDGRAKHRTKVGARAFIGCNVNLIAPVTVEAGAFVAAGSTITRDVPAEALAVARERQRNVEGWVARRAGRAAKPAAARPAPKKSTARPKKKPATSHKKAAGKKKPAVKTAAKKRPVARKSGARKKTVRKKSAPRKRAPRGRPGRRR